jgi:tetratricopeptide (TPR) repeat protein
MKKVDLDLTAILNNDPLTFLVGAGCSVDAPSCLPAGRTMMDAIIEHVSNRDDGNQLKKLEELRFESLVEIVRDNLDPELITIDYYLQCDKPNLQHFFLAQMIKAGNFVMTTNFDLLIEHALLNLGTPIEKIKLAISKADFENYRDPKSLHDDGFHVLYKIHGSGKNLITNESTKESLIATIQAFGSNKEGMSVFQVEPFKRALFENISKGRTLVIMGYSGSDDFDVVPTLKVLPELKSVIWADHGSSQEPRVFEIESSDKQSKKKVDQILAEIKEVGNVSEVYKVEINTTQFVKMSLSNDFPISSSDFELTPQQWLNEKVEVDDESIRFLIPQQLYYDYNHYEDSLRCATQLRDFALKSKRRLLEVRARLLEGKVLVSLGEHKKALSIFLDTLKMAKSLNSDEWLAASFNSIATVYNEQANYTEALSYYQKALPIFQSLGDSHEVSIVLRNMSSMLKNLNRNSEALQYSLKALEISESVGKLSDRGDILMIIGMIEVSMGKIENAIRHYEESLMINKQLHDYDAVISNLIVLGDLMIKLGNFNKALSYLNEALNLSEKFGELSKKAAALNNLGLLYTNLSNFTEATENLINARDLAKKIGDTLVEANSSVNLGLVYYYQGKQDNALKIWERSLKIYEKTGYLYGKASTLINMGDVYYQKGKYKKSFQLLNESLEIGKSSGDLSLQSNSLQKLGMVLQDQKDFKGATQLYNQGLQLSRQIGDLVGTASFINNLGTVDFYSKNYESALQKYNEALTILNQIGLGHIPLAQTILNNIEHIKLVK